MQSLNYSPLGRVYSLILSWPDLEEETAADSESLDSSTESTTADTQPTTKPLAGQGIIPVAHPTRQTTEK